MLNAIWAGMIVLGILYGAFTGNLEAVSNAALESAGEAVDLCITMCGIMGLWTGLMKIAQQAGLIAALTRGISPFVSFYFPGFRKIIRRGSQFPPILLQTSSDLAGRQLRRA